MILLVFNVQPDNSSINRVSEKIQNKNRFIYKTERSYDVGVHIVNMSNLIITFVYHYISISIYISTNKSKLL